MLIKKQMPKKILIIKLGSLGDILQTTFIIPIIKQIEPDSQIDWLCFKEYENLLINNPLINEVISSKNLILLFRKLRSKKYSHVFIFHRKIIFSILTWLLNIPHRIGFSIRKNPFLTQNIYFNVKISRPLRNLSLISNFFMPKNQTKINYNPQFILNPKNISDFVQDLSKNSYILIAPFGAKNKVSSMPSRVWPYFKELVKEINLKFPDYFIYFLGDKNNQININDIFALNSQNINLAGKLNFDELAFLSQKTALFIGNDSFLLFLALSQTKKVLGLFGPTNGDLIIGDFHKKFFQSKTCCSPCYNPLEGKKNKAYHCLDNQCMKTILVKDVISLMRFMLGLS